MILVTKAEADYIEENSTYIRIATTCKKKKSNRKKHYVDEYPETFILLKRHREELKEKGLKKLKGEIN